MATSSWDKGVLDLCHITVRRIMMPSNITVPQDFSVAEALAVLHRHRLRAVPVVDGNGRTSGIVTLSQIDRLLAVMARQREGNRDDQSNATEPVSLSRKGGSHAGKILDAPGG